MRFRSLNIWLRRTLLAKRRSEPITNYNKMILKHLRSEDMCSEWRVLKGWIILRSGIAGIALFDPAAEFRCERPQQFIHIEIILIQIIILVIIV